MKHSVKVKHYDDLKSLAEEIGNLRYDALREFLAELAGKLEEDSIADAKRNRPMLSAALKASVISIDQSAVSISKAWAISKPFEREQ